MHSWEDITSDLYSKIKPLGGTLFSSIDENFPRKRKIDNFWIEFEMNQFSYVDPFYGEQDSLSHFKTFVRLEDYISSIDAASIYDLESITIEREKEDRVGAFSNSLELTIHELIFGEIKNDSISMNLRYSLTNSESYAGMLGTIKDHVSKWGEISTILKIKELQVITPNTIKPMDIAKYVNNDVYNPNEIRLATDLNWSSPKYKGYYVPYKTERNSLNEL